VIVSIKGKLFWIKSWYRGVDRTVVPVHSTPDGLNSWGFSSGEGKFTRYIVWVVPMQKRAQERLKVLKSRERLGLNVPKKPKAVGAGR